MRRLFPSGLAELNDNIRAITLATEHRVQAVLRAIYFNNVVNSPGGPPNPSTATRTIRFTLTDDLGLNSNQPAVTVNVVAAQRQGGRILAAGLPDLKWATSSWLDDPAPQRVHSWQHVKGQILPT